MAASSTVTRSGADRRLTRKQAQQRTRAAIRDAAFEVISERGYEGSSVDAIAQRAGYTVGAIYSNFDSKRALLFDLLETAYQPGMRELSVHDLDGFLAAVADQFDAGGGAPTRELFGEELLLLAMRGDGELRDLLVQRRRARAQRLADNLERWFADVGIEPPVPVEVLAHGLLALGNGLTKQRTIDPESVSPGQVVSLVRALLGLPPEAC